MTFDELVTCVRAESLTVCTDSRSVQDGDVFVAVRGTCVDGHTFIDQALRNGAKYIVCEQDSDELHTISVPSSAKAVAHLAQASHNDPGAKLTHLAVTGTNGKTTVAYLVHACLVHAGHACGLISTINYDTGQEQAPSQLTTPDALTLATWQAQMVDAGWEYLVMEASSHALQQDRLASIPFTGAAFTNLTGDHLDYHQTKENYLSAKSILFEGLAPGATAVLNRQSPESATLAARTRAHILWYGYGTDTDADVRATITSMDITGTEYTLHYGGQTQPVHSPLLGAHNVSNHLAATGLCLAAGLDLSTIATGLSTLAVIPGRLEKIRTDRDFSCIVDYAHTDDALKNILTTLKPLCKGRLIVVFGCGGDRDRTKRPRMAHVAESQADITVITSDNPRTEAPQVIINDIRSGLSTNPACSVIIEADRKKAIEIAIDNAKINDIVVIAGKGHETYQVIGKKRIAFDDKEVALAAITSLAPQ